MTNSLPIFFTVTTGFAVTIPQSLVLADPPVAYYRLGEAPGSTIAVDSSANAHNGAYNEASIWRVLKWDVPCRIEAWVQLIDDYQVNSRILGETKTDTGDGYWLDVPLSEASPLDHNLFEARGGLGEVDIHNYRLAPGPIESLDQVNTVFERSALTVLLGLALILAGLVPREWRSPLEFRGGDAVLSRARTVQVGEVKLRKRSEGEANSFRRAMQP